MTESFLRLLKLILVLIFWKKQQFIFHVGLYKYLFSSFQLWYIHMHAKHGGKEVSLVYRTHFMQSQNSLYQRQLAQVVTCSRVASGDPLIIRENTKNKTTCLIFVELSALMKGKQSYVILKKGKQRESCIFSGNPLSLPPINCPSFCFTSSVSMTKTVLTKQFKISSVNVPQYLLQIFLFTYRLSCMCTCAGQVQ